MVKAQTANTGESHSQKDREEIKRELTECLFQQYGFTFAGVSMGTVYALHTRSPNGMKLMAIAGVTGSVMDIANGYLNNCKSQVAAYQEIYHAERKRETAGKEPK